MFRGFDSQLRTSHRLELSGTFDTSAFCAAKFAEHVLVSRKTFRWRVLEHRITEVMTGFGAPTLQVLHATLAFHLSNMRTSVGHSLAKLNITCLFPPVSLSGSGAWMFLGEVFMDADIAHVSTV